MRFIAEKFLLSAQFIMSYIIRFPVIQTARPETSFLASFWEWNCWRKWQPSGVMPSTSTIRGHRSATHMFLPKPEEKVPFLRFWWLSASKRWCLVSVWGHMCTYVYTFMGYKFSDTSVYPQSVLLLLSRFRCARPLCSRMEGSPSGSSVHGILQARILEWVAMPSSRGSSQPKNLTRLSYVSCIGRRVLYH